MVGWAAFHFWEGENRKGDFPGHPGVGEAETGPEAEGGQRRTRENEGPLDCAGGKEDDQEQDDAHDHADENDHLHVFPPEFPSHLLGRGLEVF